MKKKPLFFSKLSSPSNTLAHVEDEVQRKVYFLMRQPNLIFRELLFSEKKGQE